MRMTIRLLLLATLTLPAGLMAQPYVSGLFQWVETDFDDSNSVGARIGWHFGLVNSLELEYSNTELNQKRTVLVNGTDVDGEAEAKVHTFLANYRLSYPVTERLKIFGGGGAGVTYLDVDVFTPFGDGSAQDGVFTYALFAGVEFYILPRFSVSGAYRRLEFGDVEVEEQGFDITVETGGANVFELAATFYF